MLRGYFLRYFLAGREDFFHGLLVCVDFSLYVYMVILVVCLIRLLAIVNEVDGCARRLESAYQIHTYMDVVNTHLPRLFLLVAMY